MMENAVKKCQENIHKGGDLSGLGLGECGEELGCGV